MSQLLHRLAPKQRPSLRLRQRLEILSLPRWRLLARAYAVGFVRPLDTEKNQFDWVASEKSRETELLEEMRLNHGYNPQREKILTELIGNLDERGFFADSIHAIAGRLQVSEREIQDVRHDLQKFENQGVGSLHFVDFLLFQLARAAEESNEPTPRRMFQFFSGVHRSGGAMDFIRVMRRVHGKLDGEFLDYLRSGKIKITPWPADGETIKGRALPDVYVSPADGVPRVDMPRDFQDPSDPGIAGKNFHILRTAIELRESTLKRICECIFAHQMPFLQHGIRAIGTLAQKKIADELNLAPSTVSRALADKYAHTPHGTFPVEDFFFAELSSSRVYVNYLIGRVIDESWENILLGHQKMADRIRENFGIKVSRRFIASIRRISR